MKKFNVCKIGIFKNLTFKTSASVWGTVMNLLLLSSSLIGQTILSGDHLVDGHLSVGTTAAKRNLEVRGRVIVGSGYIIDQDSIVLNGGGSWGSGLNTVMCYGTSGGMASVAMTSGHAEGYGNVAMSDGVTGGEFTVAMSGGQAEGWHTTAMSGGMVAGGSNSVAMSGGYAFYGQNSIVGGQGTYTEFENSIVFGMYNKVEMDEWSTPIHNLFVIGNGTGNASDPEEIRYRNAFVVYGNGDIKIPKAQGDISMGEFGLEP